MRLLTGPRCALWAAALMLPLLVPGSQTTNSSSATPFAPIPDDKLQGNSSSSALPVLSSTQSTATSAVGSSTSTTHLTSTSQPTNTTLSVTSTTQPTTTSHTTRSTTASSVTSSQLNTTAVTTSKISFTSVTATSKSEAVVAKTSRFDVGSFVGGIVLTLGVLVILYIGCKTYHSRRGIQYRTIDEHDAII
ncbi:porimin isoform X1 [Chroicocephalus ridibundus]|uniref:porimin isoform X1 n=1 Tax=Chroicocephalus ridibundus TaxID=1192867 RepID=UPI002FDD6321